MNKIFSNIKQQIQSLTNVSKEQKDAELKRLYDETRNSLLRNYKTKEKIEDILEKEGFGDNFMEELFNKENKGIYEDVKEIAVENAVENAGTKESDIVKHVKDKTQVKEK